MYEIRKWDEGFNSWRYVEFNYQTSISQPNAAKFVTEEEAKYYLASLQNGGKFYNNYKVYKIGEEQPANERQLDMFATTTPPAQIKTTTPKTKNPI